MILVKKNQVGFYSQTRPPVTRGNQSQYNDPQIRFAPENLSSIKKATNHPVTSITSKFINTIPRISVIVQTTPAQHSYLVTSSTNSEMIKGIVDDYNRQRFT